MSKAILDDRLRAMVNPLVASWLERSEVKVYVSDAMPPEMLSAALEDLEPNFFKKVEGCYWGRFDCIILRHNLLKDAFKVNNVLLHELCHATGSSERLGRLTDARYCKDTEEHVAELGAILLSKRIGLDSERAEREGGRYMQGYPQARARTVLKHVKQVLSYLNAA